MSRSQGIPRDGTGAEGLAGGATSHPIQLAAMRNSRPFVSHERPDYPIHTSAIPSRFGVISVSPPELSASWSALALAAFSSAAIFATVILYTRLTGLRSFSKMSSFDFASTVAIGSTMAAVGMSGSSLLIGVVVLATFYGIQATVALLRRRFRFEAVVDNDPMLLMVGHRMLDDHLDRTRVTENDIRAKLREANVYNYDSLKAVILETTGDISVIHGEDSLDPSIFSDVRGSEHLTLS